jgi:hypothetical protein
MASPLFVPFWSFTKRKREGRRVFSGRTAVFRQSTKGHGFLPSCFPYLPSSQSKIEMSHFAQKRGGVGFSLVARAVFR